ncbi:Sodium/calcium exchanger membrane region [Lasiodiplodia theobromae]|uniref:Sodium/calcium exchanger membrane region n=1 Tax=Lasiodiplodia theobromae TaxID=45133 RepID=UPI0015C2E42A|nr:Sodium/calcium exchanger membrane region [Lasiodiplodia theobromae]KAF4543679.1 Sodium/calcium exchanger membrane region [Lasiodiplodia theobromae]
MGDPSNRFSDRINSWAKAHASNRQPRDVRRSILPLSNQSSNGTVPSAASTTSEKPPHTPPSTGSPPAASNVADSASASPAPPPGNTQLDGAPPPALDSGEKPPFPTRTKNAVIRFFQHTKDALCYSWVNVLLVFVPIGIASKPAGMSEELIFSMNAIAIIPLAGLLSHATESVASRLGDTLGALLNVSFGNAVELILFIILLAKNEIRVVQASLLGSILANLLLILGMAFLLGGLRFQEQVYNSTVTQMSACLLSLAVMSLLLPTAFHASFSSYSTADDKTLQVSRGTSVVLLLVYVLYLLFQLKSHAYLYESTPQHIIDEESHPGVLADMLNSSSSSDSSSDSSSSDTDSSSGSNTTAKKIKRAFRHRKRRKSSTSSTKETPSLPSVMSTPSVENHRAYFGNQAGGQEGSLSRRGSVLGAILSGDEADTDDAAVRTGGSRVRDFEAGSSVSASADKTRKKHRKKHRKHANATEPEGDANEKKVGPESSKAAPTEKNSRRVGFAEDPVPEPTDPASPNSSKRPFNFRQLSTRPAMLPSMPGFLQNNVFVTPPPTAGPGMATGRGLRRTASLPDRLNGTSNSSARRSIPPMAIYPGHTTSQQEQVEEPVKHVMSRTSAVMMLLISTGLVAVCADFMSDAIEPLVDRTGISQAFIGLIILPIVGNAAEHVTAVTVAAKNKMDLAIGVAVGSSIQIAIFVTPFIVILGWIMGKEMSLYFNIFETVSLFVTAFVINFLILDGRSNYLEGALLIAAYVIIAVASFFYPDGCEASQIGGSEGSC